jgi:catechol 2,3-dioxygenase
VRRPYLHGRFPSKKTPRNARFGNPIDRENGLDSLAAPGRIRIQLQTARIQLIVSTQPIHPDVRVGHVHLKVANLQRALDFYCGVLGLELIQRFGDSAAFLSAGGYHHHIGLNTWESLGGPPPAPGTTGLYHLALLYPTRAALGDALQRLIRARIPLDGASDHGVSEALYLRDPDQNGVELYWDHPRDQWPRTPGGQIAMYTRPLNLDSLLQSAATA